MMNIYSWSIELSWKWRYICIRSRKIGYLLSFKSEYQAPWIMLAKEYINPALGFSYCKVEYATPIFIIWPTRNRWYRKNIYDGTK